MAQPVLIVDDDDDVRTTLVELLGDEGYAVLEAANGREALTVLREPTPLPALILLDMMMPVMDGRAFRLEQLADARLAPVPVVILSANTLSLGKSEDLKADAVLRKPITLTQLLSVVERHCGKPGHYAGA